MFLKLVLYEWALIESFVDKTKNNDSIHNFQLN